MTTVSACNILSFYNINTLRFRTIFIKCLKIKIGILRKPRVVNTTWFYFRFMSVCTHYPRHGCSDSKKKISHTPFVTINHVGDRDKL